MMNTYILLYQYDGGLNSYAIQSERSLDELRAILPMWDEDEVTEEAQAIFEKLGIQNFDPADGDELVIDTWDGKTINID